MFQPVESSVSFPRLETEMLEFWRSADIYAKSLRRREGAPIFVFYEGPPTANGLPHPGHCLTRAIKDLFPRYRTMRGDYCQRKAGWDTHGLPVEVEVCKELGIHSKDEIEAFGVEPFIQRCQQSVWRYMQEWERLTERIGFWIRLDEAYVTYHKSYVESVWWALKTLFDRGLLYQGHKIVWWWAQGGTALSSGEVGLGYREVADPSVYVKFPLLDEQGRKTDTSLLVWTTTPWTLPSNQFAAVDPRLEYSEVVDSQTAERLVIAAALVDTVAAKAKRELTVERTYKGAHLVGMRFVPPFDNYYRTLGEQAGDLKIGGASQHVGWRVVPAEFVTTESGTGIVHQAPAFGEVDYDVLLSEQGRFDPGQGPRLICAVAPNGNFNDEAPDYCRGRWVKDCDKDIIRDLKARGLLYHQEQYVHDYPFCWRAEEDPLIQYPRQSWFIRTTQFREQMLENNKRINWLPAHIRDGRFGNFLETNVDWALSRERYWGTPLPIWVCDRTRKMEAVASYDELLAKRGVRGTDVWEQAKRQKPALPDDLAVHKPYIDAVTYDSPFADGGRMRRVPDVIDCWFDSGAMPFAQWGWPHQRADQFAGQFPADFISEALDQTRGWFYSLLAISTVLFGGEGTEARGQGTEARSDGAEAKDQAAAASGHATEALEQKAEAKGLTTEALEQKAEARGQRREPGGQDTLAAAYPHPFRNCIVLGLMLGEDGQKMSKSKRNYREPQEIFDRYGADALRWYFFANQPPWTGIRYNEQAIKDSIPEFLLRLWNVYSFFVIYANIDGFDPGQRIDGPVHDLHWRVLAQGRGWRPVHERGELDRWILSELNQKIPWVTIAMDKYDNFTACGHLKEFVDALSNWYVRRSRDRFWSPDKESPDKLDAYWTLYECLTTTCKLIAPFTPFVAEAMWRNLARSVFGERVAESVHLCDWPAEEDGAANDGAIDRLLSRRMALVREIVSLGRAARTEAKLKVRQPLQKVEVVLADANEQPWLESHAALIGDELNVRQVEFIQHAEQYIAYTLLPDLKRLGPRLGKRLPAVRQYLAGADAAALLRQLKAAGQVTLELADGPVVLESQDIQVRLQAKPGWSAAEGPNSVVVLNTQLTPELLREGYARELVRLIQDRRKELGCQYTDRIRVGIVSDSAELAAAVEENAAYIQGETLAVEVGASALDAPAVEARIAETSAMLYVMRAEFSE